MGEDLAWTSTSAGVAALTGPDPLRLVDGLLSGRAPITAVYLGAVPPAIHVCTLHVLPVLHA